MLTKVQDIEVEKKAQQKADEVKRNADTTRRTLKVAKSSAIAAIEKSRSQRLLKKASEAKNKVSEAKELQKLKSHCTLPTPVLPLENSLGTAKEKGKKARKTQAKKLMQRLRLLYL